jgi:plastocyanin
MGEWGQTLRMVALVTAAVGVGGCTSAAAPSQGPASTLPTASSVATAALTPSAAHSLAPSPTATILKITPIPDAPDSKTVVQLAAVNTRWDPTTLAAPAGKVWHIKIDNQDAAPMKHNFTIASGPTFPERIFQVPDIAGDRTFDIPALPAGSYSFICTIHPETMTGTLTIR